jgi:hypothetical protein
MHSGKQWRIDNAKRLHGLKLQLRPYAVWSRDWDHDHCAACWGKYSESGDSGVLREGYATGLDYTKGAGYEWVCQQCFAELKTEMSWTEVCC